MICNCDKKHIFTLRVYCLFGANKREYKNVAKYKYSFCLDFCCREFHKQVKIVCSL